MNLKNILLVLILLFSNNITFTQNLSITGKVLDASKKPIEFANVLVQNVTDLSSQKGNITDFEGNFRIEVDTKASYIIKVSFVGFEDWQKTIELHQSIDLGNISLQTSANELNEVVVATARNMITRKEDKLVFNVATSPLKSGYNGMEVLQRSPNIVVDTEGNISMRNEAPTVMINGRITNLSGADLANYLSNLNSDDIKAIEIQTHLSANTDAESSGGIIHIILKKKQVGFDTNLRADYTIKGKGFKNAYGGLNVNYGAEKWNIYGSYNYLFDTAYSNIQQTFDYFESQSSILTNEIYVSETHRQNYQLGFVANLTNKHIVGLEGFATDNVYSYKNNGLVDIFHQNNLQENGEALLTGLIDNQLYNLTLNYTWTMDTLNSNLKVFVDYTNQDVLRSNTTTSVYTQGVYTNLTERNIAPTHTSIYSAQMDCEKYFQNGWKLETGTKLTYTDRANTLLSDILNNEHWQSTNRTTSFNYSEQVLAAYAAVSRNIGQKSFLELGLRVENTDLNRIDLGDESIIAQNYTNWFPAFYFSRDLKDDRSISFSFSKRLRRPPFHFLNNNAIKINDFRYELGNPDLIPENVNNWELSLKDKKQSLDFYIRRTTEAINGIYYLEEQIAYYQKFNEGIQQQIGLSYNRFGNLFSWWYIKGLLSVFERKFINEAGSHSFKRITARLNISNNFKINETTNIDLIGSFISPYEDAYYIAYERYRINLMIQKLFFNKKLMCRIYVNDLFNTLEYGAERPFDAFKSIRIQRWRSRNLRLWVSYRFNNRNKVNKRTNKSKNDARGRL